jgi:DNA-binding transcriptional LysR family regulator
MRLDNRSLLTFLNVARLGSVGAAATAMSLTQPGVSRTLRKLEQNLGVNLFIRHPTGMELTSFGRALLPHAAVLEAGLHRAQEDIDLLKGASKGLARVGILPSLVPNTLPIVLKNILRKLPGVQLQILEAPNHKLVFALLHGEIDFAIAAISPEFSEDKIIASALIEDDICIVGRSKHPIMKRNQISPKDLLAYDWALQEKGGSIWRDFRALFTADQLEPPNITLTANSIHTLKLAIISSDMLTALPRIAVVAEQKAGVLRHIQIDKVTWRRQIAILRRAIGPILPAATVVLSEFRAALRGSHPPGSD